VHKGKKPGLQRRARNGFLFTQRSQNFPGPLTRDPLPRPLILRCRCRRLNNDACARRLLGARAVLHLPSMRSASAPTSTAIAVLLHSVRLPCTAAASSVAQRRPTRRSRFKRSRLKLYSLVGVVAACNGSRRAFTCLPITPSAGRPHSVSSPSIYTLDILPTQVPVPRPRPRCTAPLAALLPHRVVRPRQISPAVCVRQIASH
jgi:hypothetical protein